MKRTIIITTIVFLLGTGAFFAYSTFAPSVPSETELTDETSNGPLTAEALELEAEGSFGSIIANNQPVECLFSYKDIDNAGRSEGTFIYADGKFAITSVTAYDGVAYDSQIISDGEYTYIWGDSPNGAAAIKLKVPPPSESGAAQAAPGFKLDQPVSYTCTPNNPDAATFTPPADITFTDMTALYGATVGE